MADRQWIDPLFAYSGLRGSEFSTVNLYNWRRVNKTRVAKGDGLVLLVTEKWNWSYLWPVGTGDPIGALKTLRQDADARGKPFEVHGVPEEAVQMLQRDYPGQYVFEEMTEYFDYLYTREKLVTLAGKKMHGKRNHIARFVDNHPDWRYEPISAANLEDVRAMAVKWGVCNNCADDKDKREELEVVFATLDRYEEEALMGGLIRTNRGVIAFAIGEPLTKDTFVVHIEKAFADIQGAYAMINRQFALHAMEGYTYVNREEDGGAPGLRKAKMSYQPDMLYRRWLLRIAEDKLSQ